jgi:nitrate/nitrite-specific signal transduction histidine kinase
MSGKSRPRSRPRMPSTTDLLGQRDTFIHTFFKKGAELTEELLREDEKLRNRLRELEAENAALRAQVASDDAIRDLLLKIESLEREKNELVSRYTDAEASSTQYSRRFSDIEAENAKLASLYVASYQLHSSLDLRTVIRHIKELLAQFVGARSFAIYLADHEKQEVVPVASEGVATSNLRRVRFGEGPIGAAFASGHAQWVEGDSTAGTLDEPAACVPMRMDDLSVGVIVVFSTFEQKPSFVDVDFELFRLLGAHAASALAASRLFAVHGGRISSVEAFLEVDQ